MKSNQFGSRLLLLTLCLLSHNASAPAFCPVAKPSDSTVFRKVCHYEDVNVTVHRCLHDFGSEVYVNYSVERNVNEFVPITVEIHQNRSIVHTFRCEDGSIPGIRGKEIIKVVFKEQCKDPTIVINKLLTVNLSLELEVKLTDDERQCNTITIGPQRLDLSLVTDSQSGQEISVLQLLNVDRCNRNGPAVPIKLSTSTNASITMHPDGHNVTVGDISVQPLPCDDNHTQEYEVTVPSTEDYTVSAEILFALLPKKCIVVHVSTSGADALLPTLYIVLPIVAFVIIVIIGIICGGLALAFLCRKYKREYGVHDIQDSEPPESRPEAASAETTPPTSETQMKLVTDYKTEEQNTRVNTNYTDHESENRTTASDRRMEPVTRNVWDSQRDVQRQSSGSAELDCRGSRSWTDNSSPRHTQTVDPEVDLQTAV